MNTGLSSTSSLFSLTGDTVVIIGKEYGDRKLKQFNMKDKKETFSETIKIQPSGLAEIELGGTPTLAISYR